MNYEIKFRLTIIVSESTNKPIFSFYHFHIFTFFPSAHQLTG